MDAKGRSSLPARFREGLGTGARVAVGSGKSAGGDRLDQAGKLNAEHSSDQKVILTSGLEPCISVYPLHEWLAFEERVSALPQFDPRIAMLRRIVVSGAVECELDRLGRILVPANLRQHARLGREVVWAGMGRHIELWDKEAFEAMRGEVLASATERQAIAARLAELGL